MPSKYQTGAGTSDYDSEPKKMLATKNDLTIAALIRGIRDPERAKAYIEAEVALADEEDRDTRKEIIGACNRKQSALGGRGTADTPVESETSDHTDDDEEDDVTAKNRQSDEDSGEADPEDDDPYPDVPRYDSVDDLQDAVEAHEHGDAFTTAKEAGTLAGCFKCEAHIGFVPRDRDAGGGL